MSGAARPVGDSEELGRSETSARCRIPKAEARDHFPAVLSDRGIRSVSNVLAVYPPHTALHGQINLLAITGGRHQRAEASVCVFITNES